MAIITNFSPDNLIVGGNWGAGEGVIIVGHSS